MNRFQLGEVIGKGSYAYVRLARDRESGASVAIKTYDRARLNDNQKKDNVRREISILQKCSHDNIIKLVAVVETDEAINIVMEYVGALSMREYLRKFEKRRITEDDARGKFR
jgi:serine/threonine protein kinase